MAAWARLTLGCLVVAGCGGKTPVVAPLPTNSVHPDLQCPPGTLGAGEGPPNGTQVWCELPSLTDPVKQGPSIGWHENGRKQAEGSWLAGERHGDWRYWHPNGRPEAQGTYAHGLREGLWTRYHPDGSRAAEGSFVGDQEHGAWTFWDATALTRTDGIYELGQRTGRWLDVDPAGVPVRERLYQEGRLVNQREL